MTNRQRITTGLKLAIAATILVVLVATGRLSLAPLRSVLGSPGVCLALVALQLAIMALGAVRWWLILGAIEGHKRSLWSLLVYTWVGLFFGNLLPSAIATDSVRYHYLRRGDSLPASVLTSILVDRICGVASLGLLALVFAPRILVRVVSVEAMWIVIGTVTVTVALAALVYRFQSVRRALRTLGEQRLVSLGAVAIGFVAHGLKVLSLWLIVSLAVPDTSMATVFAFAPVGFVIEGLPLAPGGLGSAHLMFDYLFDLFGIPGGAGLFNVYFIARMVVNLGGGVLWIAGDRSERATA